MGWTTMRREGGVVRGRVKMMYVCSTEHDKRKRAPSVGPLQSIVEDIAWTDAIHDTRHRQRALMDAIVPNVNYLLCPRHSNFHRRHLNSRNESLVTRRHRSGFRYLRTTKKIARHNCSDVPFDLLVLHRKRQTRSYHSRHARAVDVIDDYDNKKERPLINT